MVLSWAGKVLQNWSAKAVLQRLDKRKLQQELDTHRLYLLTSYFKQHSEGLISEGQDNAGELSKNAEDLKFEGMQSAVASNLHHQLASLATVLHHLLERQGDPTHPATQLSLLATKIHSLRAQQAQQAQQQEVSGRGFSFAFGRIAAPSSSPDPPQNPAPAVPLPDSHEAGSHWQRSVLSAAELAAAFRAQHGFTLRVGPSSVQHSEAGDGLWVEGRVALGQIVALYPGVTYTPLQYRHIPGYPKIDRGNPYFIGRFDGVVLDAKPWGRGFQAEYHKQGGSEIWPENPLNPLEAALRHVEGRHPLAHAHFANHPPPGSAPNVMVAAFDFAAPGNAPHLRAYIPNVGYQDPAQKQQAQRAQQQAVHAAQQVVPPEDTVAGLALVALRDLQEEEVFLNYRLSPHVNRPDWYTPVDADEEQRRWA